MGNNLLRVTGMVSGMDTESIISMYASKTKTKLEKAKKSKTLNTYKQDAWKSLNSKIYSFYSKTLSATRLSGAYRKQKATSSNGALSVTAGATAANGVQTAQIKQAAAAAYLTGDKVADNVEGSSSLTEALNITAGTQISFKANSTADPVTIQIGGTSDDENVKVVNTMDELTKVLKDAGVNANFDAANHRLFVSAKETGSKNDFSFTAAAVDTVATDALTKLGITAGKKIKGEDAILNLNGVDFTSDSNTFSINGSTYTINYAPADPNEKIAITTSTDYDGVYNVVKDMLKEYNSLVNEMSKNYNAESAKDYEPLTDEQKEQMSEKEIEEWEKKIKDSILRKDDKLNDVLNTMTGIITKGFEVNGEKMYLSNFGISTAGYFSVDANERYALHIDGDIDDDISGANEDKLRSMIATDPEKVMGFFQQMSQELYTGLYDCMSSDKSLSSIYKVYNDKQLASEATDWDNKIKELEDKITAIEDKWYSRFSKMETKLAKLQKNETAVSGFFS